MNKYSPGAACDCDCEAEEDLCLLIDDNFNRADDPSPGPEWVEEDGNCSIVSMALSLVTSSQVICVDPNPDNAYTIVTVNFTLPSSSAGAYVFLGWLDTSNYLYCLVRTTFIRVGSATTGEQLDVSHTLSTGVTYSLSVCYDGTLLVGRVSGAGEAVISGLTAPGDRHGVGAFNGTIVFDNFIARKVGEDCEECTYTTTIPCSQCETGDLPRFWRVDISGVVIGSNPAFRCTSGCDDINGTWIIDMDNVVSHGEDEFTGHASCAGEIEGPTLGGCPGAPNAQNGVMWIALHAAFFLNGPPYQRDTRVHIKYPVTFSFASTPFYRWGTAVAFGSATPVIPCEDAAMVGLTLDPVTDDSGCDFTGMTVTITPLS